MMYRLSIVLYRMYRVKKKFKNLKRAVVLVQKNWKRLQVSRNYRKMRRGFMRLQAVFRGRKVRKWYRVTMRRIKMLQVSSSVCGV